MVKVLWTELEGLWRGQFGDIFDLEEGTLPLHKSTQHLPNIEVQFVSKSEIDQQCAFLDAKWKGVMAVPQTHKVHCIRASGTDEVVVADTSNEIEISFRVCRIRNTVVTPPTTLAPTTLAIEQESLIGDESQIENEPPSEDNTTQLQLPALNLTIGQWVFVKYEDEEFPGEVTAVEDVDIEVNVLHRSANAQWKWPRPEDKIFYPRNRIVRVINPPSVAGNRGQFVFRDL